MLLTPTHVTDSELKKEKEDGTRHASRGLAGKPEEQENPRESQRGSLLEQLLD